MIHTPLTFPNRPTHPLLRALENREAEHRAALRRQAVEAPNDAFEQIGAAANRVIAQLLACRKGNAA